MSNFVDRLLLLFEVQNNNALVAIRQTENALKKVAATQKIVTGSMLSFGLSMLFTGMALKKLGENILNSLVKTYMQATDEQNRFNQEIMAVQASFEFLKFSIMDALGNSDFVIGFIEMLISLNNVVSEFINKHPLISATIGAFAVGTIVVGGLMMVIGQTILGILGLIAGFVLLQIVMASTTASNILGWFSAIGLAILGVVLIIGIIVGAFYAIKAVAESNLHPVLKLLIIIGIAFAAILAIAAILGITISLPFIIAALVIAVVIAAIVLMAQKLGGLDLAFKAFGIFILAILAFIGDAFYEAMIIPLRAIIALINTAILASNKFLGTDFKTIAQPEFAPMSKKVWEWRNELIAEGEKRKQEQADAEAKTKLEESNKKGDVNVNVYGDVTDSHLMDTIKKGIEATLGETNNRYNGTTQGA